MSFSLSLGDIANWLDLSLSEQDGAIKITGASIDTRTLLPGNLFLAFRGESVDGHDFIPEAIKKGAAAILCTDEVTPCDVPVLQYPDLEKALIIIAKAYRANFTCPVVALTGSNGKTTVKEMLGAILGPSAFKTPGNFNNHLGVPLSILQVKPSHEYAVFELGANHIGEIQHTVALAMPDVALVNNIGTAHIEGFGSVEGIAKGKGEIYEGLSSNGTAVINADDAYVHFWDDIVEDKTVLRFSKRDSNASVYAEAIEALPSGGTVFQLMHKDKAALVTLNVPGLHQVQNALAAATCAIALGISLEQIATGLSQFSGVSGRLMSKKTPTGALILDDTYNANLNSVLVGINLLATHKGTRILVLGDMGELGEHAKAHHKAVGDAAKTEGIDKVFTCGTLSEAASEAFGARGEHFQNQAQLVLALRPILNDRTTVLVKGSRSSAMEQVVAGLFE